jgi:AcrR family transcriptional regulator
MSPVKIGAEAILAVDREPLRDTSHVVESGTGTRRAEGRCYSGSRTRRDRSNIAGGCWIRGSRRSGRAGCDQVTVKDVCRHAGLTERYFYEQFSDRYGPMVAIYNDVIAVVMDTLIAPTRGAPEHLPSRKRVQAPLWRQTPYSANSRISCLLTVCKHSAQSKSGRRVARERSADTIR